MDRTDEDVPRRISQPERESRKNALRQRLQPGLIVAGLHDPGDSIIINRFLQMVDENLLGWVPWECCPTFRQELDARPTKKRWLPDSKGVVTERTLKDTPEANMSDHLFIDLALQLRGLAADIAGVVSFKSHEVIRRKLMMALVENPPDSRHSRPLIEHVRNADKFFWGQMAKELSSGIKPLGGRLLADDAVSRIMSRMEFAMKLQPLPAPPSGKKSKKRSAAASSGSDESEHRVKGKGSAKKKAIKQDKKDLEALRKEREIKAAAGGGGKAASKGKLKVHGKLTLVKCVRGVGTCARRNADFRLSLKKKVFLSLPCV